MAAAVVALTAIAALARAQHAEQAPAASASGCPAEMVRVDRYCIDRWEASMVDKTTRRPLSPYYPPQPKLLREVYRAWQFEAELMGDEAARLMPLPDIPDWQKHENFAPMAVSKPGAVPQAYVSQYLAREACENAGKRLCTYDEWVHACRGAQNTPFPYGTTFDRAACNVWGYVHPAFVLHENSSIGHRDPRLNLVTYDGEHSLLRRTGATPTCASRWGADAIYDMVGNLDEWVEGEKPRFVGGFYARPTSKGCESSVTNHAAIYSDYSTGTRCCKDAL